MKKASNTRKKTFILGACALLSALCISCNKDEGDFPLGGVQVEKPSVLGETTTQTTTITPTMPSDKERDLTIAKELVLSMLYQVMSLEEDVSGMELHWKTDWKWGDYEVFLCYKTDQMTDPEAIATIQKLNVELIADYYTLMKEKEGNCDPEEWNYLVDSVNYMWPAHSDWGKQEKLVLSLEKNNRGEYYVYCSVAQWADALGLSNVADPTVDFSSWTSESQQILRQYDVVLACELWSAANNAILSAEIEVQGAKIIWKTSTGEYSVVSEEESVQTYLEDSLNKHLLGNVGVAVSEMFLAGDLVFEVGKDLIENPYLFSHNPFVAEILGMPNY